MPSVEIEYYGHSGFHVEIDGRGFIFDPYLIDNPKASIRDPLEMAPATDVLITHDHRDHGISEAIIFCKENGARLVAINELALYAREKGVKNLLRGNIGGFIDAGDGFSVKFIAAYHSCERGVPCGFIVNYGGVTLAHLGDTGLSPDLELIGRMEDIDISFIPIGSHFTMDPREAAEAARMMGCKIAIPMHYGTFPEIERDPQEFVRSVGDTCNVELFDIGEKRTLQW